MFDPKRDETGELLDVNDIRLDFPVLRREVHGQRLVYLDSAAYQPEATDHDRQDGRDLRAQVRLRRGGPQPKPGGNGSV